MCIRDRFWIERSSGAKIVASFEYAVRLMELPQGVFGVSLATFLLPTLAGLAAEKQFPEFRENLRRAMGYLFFVNTLAAVMLMVLAGPMVRLLFEHGAFTADSTRRASFALMCLAPSLLTYSAVNVMARAFYALGDTKVPMQISAVSLCINIVVLVPLVFMFPKGYQAGALGVANAISSLVNVGLLSYALKRKMPSPEAAILGCTHYPLMQDVFQDALGPSVKVYSQADLVAESLEDYLARHPDKLGDSLSSIFLTTGDPRSVSDRATQFLRRRIVFEQA